MNTTTAGDGNSDLEMLTISEPFEETEIMDGNSSCLKQIITNFKLHLSQKASCSLGCHANLSCNHYIALSPLLRLHLNNVGDPFHESNFALHTKNFEVAVLDWFAKLWGIRKDEYWGYVTNGGTESNLQGLLLGRELLTDGIFYTSKESHYSIFKAARICKMKCQVVDALITGEMDCNDLQKKLILNKDKPAIINVTIGTTFNGGVDNLDHVIETLHQCGFSDDRFYIHCDAALNGIISPFVNQGVCLDFKKSIGSITVSGHKLIGLPMPCGIFITRKRHIGLLSQNIEYIDGLKNAGISVMHKENSNIVVFERPIDEDFVKHWQLSCQGNIAHVTNKHA